MTTSKQLSYLRSLERRLNRDPLPFPELLSSVEASKYIARLEDASNSARRARRSSGSLPAFTPSQRLAVEPQHSSSGISAEVRAIIDEAIAEAMARRLVVAGTEVTEASVTAQDAA